MAVAIGFGGGAVHTIQIAFQRRGGEEVSPFSGADRNILEDVIRKRRAARGAGVAVGFAEDGWTEEEFAETSHLGFALVSNRLFGLNVETSG